MTSLHQRTNTHTMGTTNRRSSITINSPYTYSRAMGSQLKNINWQYVLEMCNIRNLVQQGADEEEEEKKRRTKMIQELQFIQSQDPDIPKALTNFINATEEQLTTMTVQQVELYLQGAKMLHTTQKQLCREEK
jgi:hypothetical protein